jgi:DMSO/TMAO reductase YedYZ molybdopterin-dependent catalytic subunit
MANQPEPRASPRSRVPPGQGVTRGWPVLHVGDVPVFDPELWRLQVCGEVERTLELTWAEFTALPESTLQADFHCVTGWSKLENAWQGVRLAELAQRAGVRPAARFVRFADGRAYDTTVPLAIALEEGLLARCHDGRALAPAHGGPLRAVVPRLYAWKSCKWLRAIEFLARERLGFWERRGYHNDADPWREERLV